MNTPDGIFIGGCDRSGTTLLMSVINAHPEAMLSYETYFPVRLHGRFGRLSCEQIPELVDTLIAHPVFSGLRPESIHRHIGNGGPDFSRVIRAAYLALAESNGKSLWGDKSPAYARHFDFLATLFPSGAMIHIYRDPRAVAYSLISMPWGPNTAKHAAEYWLKTVLSAMRSLRCCVESGRALAMCYESLVSQPELEIARLCNFLGIERHDKMLDGMAHRSSASEKLPNCHPNLGRPISTKQTTKWLALPRRDIEVIEAICGDAMDELGYERVSRVRSAGIGLRRRVFYALQGRWRRATKTHARREC